MPSHYGELLKNLGIRVRTAKKSINLKILKRNFTVSYPVRDNSPENLFETFVAETRRSNRRIFIIAVLGVLILLFLVGCTYAFNTYSPVLTVRNDAIPSMEVSINTYTQKPIEEPQASEKDDSAEDKEPIQKSIPEINNVTPIAQGEKDTPISITPVPTIIERINPKKLAMISPTSAIEVKPIQGKDKKETTELNLFNILNVRISK